MANSAICILDIGDVPSSDVSVIESTKFFGKKKTVRIKIRYIAPKTISYFWFPQGMIIFPGGVRQKRNFLRGGGGVRFESQFLENPEGRGGS